MLWITACKWSMTLGHRGGIVPCWDTGNGHPLSQQREKRCLAPSGEGAVWWPWGVERSFGFSPVQPNTHCLASRQVQAVRSVAATVKCKDTERHKRSVPSFNKKSKIRLYPIPRCETPCSCVRSVEATQIFLLPQLDAVQLWHFKDLMLGSQSCQRLCLLF